MLVYECVCVFCSCLSGLKTLVVFPSLTAAVFLYFCSQGCACFGVVFWCFGCFCISERV